MNFRADIEGLRRAPHFWPPLLACSGRPGWRDAGSGLILPRNGRPRHGVLAVIAAERQNLDADVGAVRQQLALEDQADLLPAEIPGRILERVETELDHAMRRGRERVVVRRQPLQLSGSLQSVRDRPDPLQVLALLAKRVIDLVHVLDHRTSLLLSPPPPRKLRWQAIVVPPYLECPARPGPKPDVRPTLNNSRSCRIPRARSGMMEPPGGRGARSAITRPASYGDLQQADHTGPVRGRPRATSIDKHY